MMENAVVWLERKSLIDTLECVIEGPHLYAEKSPQMSPKVWFFRIQAGESAKDL
jgi:hypothetical protein